MNEIVDYKSYNDGMHKSMLDKLFFIDKIENIEYILDYGCADGELLRNINKIYPQIAFTLGYDINEKMLDLARQKDKNEKSFFYSDLNELLNNKFFKPENTCLNLSSIIHEIYSYCANEEIIDFWDFVFNNKFKYIAIRDMCISESCNRNTEINDYKKLLTNANSQQLKEYESQWSSCSNNKNMIHFLLKYRYLTNWNREVKENYLPIIYEDLLKIIPDEYEIIYMNHYTLPFFKSVVKKDFDIDIKDNTHIQLLLKRKEEEV